jgi:hypothetical protein
MGHEARKKIGTVHNYPNVAKLITVGMRTLVSGSMN